MLVFINGQKVDTESQEFSEFLQLLPDSNLIKQFFSVKEKDLFEEKSEDFIKPEEFVPGFIDEPKKEVVEEKNEAVCSGNPENCERCGESFLADFSDALDSLKEGYTVTRKSWLDQGKKRFLYLVSPNVYPARTEIAQKVFGDEVPYSGYIALKTDAGYVTPYTPTTSDLLSEDWVVIDN